MTDMNSYDESHLPELSNETREYLKKLAYNTVESTVLRKPLPELKHDDPVLNQQWGAFVTLRTHNGLRGCIGSIVSPTPLPETIADMAMKSASSDPRFPPMSAAELPYMDVEISILGPLTEVKDINEIEIGRHGLVIEQGYRKGLLLPQVATENNMDIEMFLSQTCMKAGLPPDSWRHEAKIYKFEAVYF